MRGSWGRKKRSVAGIQQVTPLYKSSSSDDYYWNVQRRNKTGFVHHENLLKNLSKKSIPKIDEKDVERSAEYYNVI